MIRFWTGIVARLWAPEGGLPLGLFRMALALTVLVAIGSVVTHDLVEVLWVDRDFGGYRDLGRGPWLVEALGGPTPAVVWGLTWAGLALGGLLLAGLGGRVTAFLTLQVFLALTDLNGHAGGSYDELIKNGLWLCVLAPTTATASVDAWLLRGHPLRGRPVPAWGRVLIAFQLVLVYWTTGLQKVSAYWVPGGDFSALYYILQQPSWQLTDLSLFAYVFPLTQVGTAVTWLWEVTAPLWLLALFYRGTRTRGGRLRRWFNALDVRTLYAGVGLFFHTALLLTLDVGPFPLASLAFYFAFWSPDELSTLLRRAGDRVGLTRFLLPSTRPPSTAATPA